MQIQSLKSFKNIPEKYLAKSRALIASKINPLDMRYNYLRCNSKAFFILMRHRYRYRLTTAYAIYSSCVYSIASLWKAEAFDCNGYPISEPRYKMMRKCLQLYKYQAFKLFEDSFVRLSYRKDVIRFLLLRYVIFRN